MMLSSHLVYTACATNDPSVHVQNLQQHRSSYEQCLFAHQERLLILLIAKTLCLQGAPLRTQNSLSRRID